MLGQREFTRDSSYFKSYVSKFIVKLNFDSQASDFLLTDAEIDEVELRTNTFSRVNLSLDYDWIGIGVGFEPEFLKPNGEEDRKGDSSFSEIGIRFFLKNWVQDLRYTYVRGFYVENTEDIIPGWNPDTDPYIQFPDLQTITYKGSTAYVFNNNFSIRNVTYNTEWQLKSAGSFVPSLRYNYNRISFSNEGIKQFENNFNFSLIASYYYTWVIGRHWYVAPEVSPGLGVRFTNSGAEGRFDREKNTTVPLLLDGALQLGYASERWIFGINFSFQTTYLESGLYSQREDRFFGRIYLGYRFNAPGFIDRPMKKFNSWLGL